MYRGKIFYPGDDTGILARSLHEFYNKHDPKREGLEAHVEMLMRTWSRGEVARALRNKYGTLPLRWRKYTNEPDPERPPQGFDPEPEEDGFKAIKRMLEEDKRGDYTCGLDEDTLEAIFKDEGMEDDIEKMWDDLGIEAKYNHTLPIEPASLGGSVRAQVVRKDPYRPIGQQDPPYVVGREPEEETNTGRQRRDADRSMGQSKGSKYLTKSGEHPQYPGTGMSAKASSREMHLVKGGNGVIYNHAMPRGGGGEAKMGGRGFGEKKGGRMGGTMGGTTSHSFSESVDDQIERAIKRPEVVTGKNSLSTQYTKQRSSARPTTFLATLTSPQKQLASGF
jgi:hypothetical protein